MLLAGVNHLMTRCVIGAFLGGFLFSLLTGRGTYFDWNIGSFVVAVRGIQVCFGSGQW